MPDNKLKDNEIKKDISFEKKTAYYKKEIKDFFSRYENKSSGEDCTEVCLICAGYRTVLKAEKEINCLQAKVIKEQNKNNKLRNERNHLQAKAYKECIEKVKERLAVYSFTSNSTEYDNGVLDCMEWVDSKIEELEKELVSDDNA